MSNEDEIIGAMRKAMEEAEAEMRERSKECAKVGVERLFGQSLAYQYSADIIREAINRTWPQLSFHEAWGRAGRSRA